MRKGNWYCPNPRVKVPFNNLNVNVMKNCIYIVIVFLMFYGTSCQEDEISFFTDSRFIQFPYGENTLSYSFMYSQGSDRHEVLIPVKYVGAKLEENATVAWEIIADKTTAVAGEYDVLLEQPFRADFYQDTLRVMLIDSERLKEQSVDLCLRLISNASFEASTRDSLEIKITYTHKIDKPEWWSQEVVDSYLGTWSEVKLTEFVNHIYAGDYGALEASEKLYYARQFKYYLESLGKPLYDENGGVVTVPVIG